MLLRLNGKIRTILHQMLYNKSNAKNNCSTPSLLDAPLASSERLYGNLHAHRRIACVETGFTY